MLSTAAHGPYIGSVLRHLTEIEPSSVGLFGTVIVVPSSEGLAYRALDPSPTIRSDLSALCEVAPGAPGAGNGEHEVSLIPLWRLPGGSLRPAPFESEKEVQILRAPDSALEAVLLALEASGPWRLPYWLERQLDAARWDLFARVAAAALQADGAASGAVDDLALRELWRRCADRPEIEWFEIARAQLGVPQ